MCGTRHKDLREQAKANRLPPPEAGLISTHWLFQNLPKSSALFRCVTPPALRNPASNMGYCDISEWHVRFARALAREHLRQCLHLTNPSRKVLSLTKPKGINRNPSAIILQKVLKHDKSSKLIEFEFTKITRIGKSLKCDTMSKSQK